METVREDNRALAPLTTKLALGSCAVLVVAFRHLLVPGVSVCVYLYGARRRAALLPEQPSRPEALDQRGLARVLLP